LLNYNIVFSILLQTRKEMSLPDAANVQFHEGVMPLDGEVAELSVLVPTWQANALERVAGNQGMTSGQLLRRILQQVISTFPGLMSSSA
jgi:hypothetical protein